MVAVSNDTCISSVSAGLALVTLFPGYKINVATYTLGSVYEYLVQQKTEKVKLVTKLLGRLLSY